MMIAMKLLVIIAWICAATTHVQAGRGANSIEAANSYPTTDNGRTATRDRSGVREKKLSQGEGEEEEGVGGRTTAAGDPPVYVGAPAGSECADICSEPLRVCIAGFEPATAGVRVIRGSHAHAPP